MLQNPVIELKKSFDYFLLGLKKYAQFSGRATRSEYWYFYVFTTLIELAIRFLTFSVNTFNHRYCHLNSAILNFPEILDSVFILSLLIPSMAIACRRLHDRNFSGWVQIWEMLLGLFFLLCFALSFISIFYNPLGADAQLQEVDNFGSNILLTTFAGILSGLAFYSQKGTSGENRFGKESLERADDLCEPPPLSRPMTTEAIFALENMMLLREKGILTEKEFQEAKERLLK